MFEVSVEETFAAGHALRNYQRQMRERAWPQLPGAGDVRAVAELDSIGLLVDFVEVKKLMRLVVDRLDHQFLNDMAPFDVLNPSAENIAKYFYDEISGGLGDGNPVRLGQVRIWETDSSSATYRR